MDSNCYGEYSQNLSLLIDTYIKDLDKKDKLLNGIETPLYCYVDWHLNGLMM